MRGGSSLGARNQIHVHGVDEWVVTIAAHPRRYGITGSSELSVGAPVVRGSWGIDVEVFDDERTLTSARTKDLDNA